MQSSITYFVALVETSQITFQGGGSSAKTNVARGTLLLASTLVAVLADDVSSQTLVNNAGRPQTLPTLGALRPRYLLLDPEAHPGLHLHHLLPKAPELLEHTLQQVSAGHSLDLVHLPLPVGCDLRSHLQLSLAVQDVGVQELLVG